MSDAIRARGTDRRGIVLLDGDVVRQMLSRGLGFSPDDRELNLQRIGYVASLVNQCDGVAVCAPIAPYARSRAAMRDMSERDGGSFVEVHVAATLAQCEQRDTKGLYAKARAGALTGMTGVDDPYEVPDAPDVRFEHTDNETPEQTAEHVYAFLLERGFVQNRS